MQKISNFISWIEIVLLPLVDVMALTAAFFISFWLRIETGIFFYQVKPDLFQHTQLFILSLPLFLIIFFANRLYDPLDLFYGTVEYIRVIKGVAFGILAFILISFLLHDFLPARGWLVFFWILATIFMGLERFILRRVVRHLFRSGKRSERVLVIGANEEAIDIARRLMGTSRMEVVGFLDEFTPVGEEVFRGLRVKGTSEDYERIAREERVAKMILVPGAVSWETHRGILSAAVRGNALTILVSSGFSDLFSANLRVSYVGYIPLLCFRPGYVSGLNKMIKGILDWILGCLLFLLAVPVLFVVGILTWCHSGWPVWHVCEVFGKNMRPFNLYTIRTNRTKIMNRYFEQISRDEPQEVKDDKFSLDKFLLRSGLDKLPQLINVLKGEMSLVGPRPLHKDLARRYDPWLSCLLAVKPGMTGPWAIEGGEKLEQEISTTVFYIQTWTPWKDLQILILTFFYLLQRRLKVRVWEQ